MSGFDVLDLVPLGPLFVVAFAVIPILNTIYEEGLDSIDSKKMIAFALIIGGALVLLILSEFFRRNQFNVWPGLLIMTAGFLLYLKLMRDRGELHEEPEMGGTSYE